MNRATFILSLLLASASASAAAPVQASAREVIEGVWRNRPNTLVVRIAPCGPDLCGTVVEATEDAKESTRKAGTPNLVGTKVLTRLHKSAADTYSGQVFNPNLNIHAAGTVTLVSPTVLIVKGCVLAGIICRQQHWTRVD
jgi:uncharacterized protein (DUF2147 family)